MSQDHESVVDLYERHAEAFDRDRPGSVMETAWLNRFLDLVPRGGEILDVGCGMGEPIAKFFIDSGYRVVGIDSSPSLISMCEARYPESEWAVVDMRQMALGRRFDGVIAWDSFFHLKADDQRAMFLRFAAHARVGAPLMFTSGPAAGEAIGRYRGEPLYHASLDASEYEALLETAGFTVVHHRANDPECGDHTIWLAALGDPTIRSAAPQQPGKA